MRQFVIKLFIFLLPLILISAIFEYKIRSIDSYYQQKINGLIEQADSVELLILGSSHAAEGIDPSQFNLKAYNMAFGSQTIYYDKWITINHLDEFPNLRYVFVSVDYHSLYYTHNPSRDIFYHYYYDIDYEEETYLEEDISCFLFGFEPEVVFAMMEADYEELNNGWFSYDTTYYSTFEDETVNKRVNHFNTIIQKNLLEKESIIKDLEQLIESLLDRNVTPVIISSPLHQAYFGILDSNILNQNTIDIHSLCDKYQLEHWSYQAEHFEDWEYLDNSHLNKTGAKRYARMLNERLLALDDK